MSDVFNDIDALISKTADDVTRATLQQIADHMLVVDAANASYLEQLWKTIRHIEQLKVALTDLADLVDAMVGSKYRPNRFTTQPARLQRNQPAWPYG